MKTIKTMIAEKQSKGNNYHLNKKNGILLIPTFFIITFLFFTSSLNGQELQRNINVKYITNDIEIDGVLDESDWETAEKGGDLWQFFPTDSTISKYPTEFRLMYNDNYLYIGIRAVSSSDNYVVSSLRRDYRGTTSDNITFMFDTFNDANTAFLFGMTPYGVQREAFISLGGNRGGFNPNWDQKWQVESKMFDDHYVLEAAIPFSSVKFNEGETQWRMQCYRWDIGGNEQSAWSRVPQNQMLSSLAFMGNMVFEEPLGKSRTPVAIIPYMNALTSKDFNTGLTDSQFKIGGDAKVAIGNSMNLDITLNPDFSNVEVDAIFTNLTRFEVRLPERRQFFIDNSDLFGTFGSSRDANPFFSRRIGLARNSSGSLIENRILGGVRLSGKLNEDWRLGFLNVQTDEDIQNGIGYNNNMMLALQKMVFSRSNIGLFMVNRQTIKDYDFLDSSDKYNRVVGVDYNLASEDNTWTGKFYLHKSFQPDDNKGNLSTQATVTYNTRKFSYTNDWVYVDEDFRSDLGFIPRRGFFKSGNGMQFKFYPKEGIINTHTLQPMAVFYWDPNQEFKQTDHDFRLGWEAEFKDQSELDLRLVNRYIFLNYDFDPTRTEGGTPLQGNKGYTFNQFTASYRSNNANKFTYNVTSTVGQFYTGSSYSMRGAFSLRIQPWVLLNLNMNYTGIRLPDPHPSADLWLVSPHVDVTFSKKLFWSTLVQYSNQRNNLGINSRLQWRFAPLSDIYLVYNDNYFTEDFAPRFRSLNLKITYWLNI